MFDNFFFSALDEILKTWICIIRFCICRNVLLSIFWRFIKTAFSATFTHRFLFLPYGAGSWNDRKLDNVTCWPLQHSPRSSFCCSRKLTVRSISVFVFFSTKFRNIAAVVDFAVFSINLTLKKNVKSFAEKVTSSNFSKLIFFSSFRQNTVGHLAPSILYDVFVRHHVTIYAGTPDVDAFLRRYRRLGGRPAIIKLQYLATGEHRAASFEELPDTAVSEKKLLPHFFQKKKQKFAVRVWKIRKFFLNK